MKYQLTAHEARVIGCLLEKQVSEWQAEIVDEKPQFMS